MAICSEIASSRSLKGMSSSSWSMFAATGITNGTYVSVKNKFKDGGNVGESLTEKSKSERIP